MAKVEHAPPFTPPHDPDAPPVHEPVTDAPNAAQQPATPPDPAKLVPPIPKSFRAYGLIRVNGNEWQLVRLSIRDGKVIQHDAEPPNFIGVCMGHLLEYVEDDDHSRA